MQRIYQGSSPPLKIMVNQAKNDRALANRKFSFSAPPHRRSRDMTVTEYTVPTRTLAKDIPYALQSIVPLFSRINR